MKKRRTKKIATNLDEKDPKDFLFLQDSLFFRRRVIFGFDVFVLDLVSAWPGLGWLMEVMELL